jgi:DNA-directed RNA polymerase subunit alpha
MYNLDKFKIKVVKDDSSEALLEIGPFPKGFGQTIGNSLRRILLTSISGSAVTSVKIDGIKHEYTTLDGVQDDVFKLLLNLKNLSVRSYSETPVVLKLSKKGEKGKAVQVTAADFEINSDIEIFNPDLVITELTLDKAQLNMEITIEQGLGYGMPDEEKRSEIGVIPVDALYSPVKHVKMDVVSTRVGKHTDYETIVFTIITDESRKPTDAFLEAVEIFDLVANRLVDLSGGDSENNKLAVEVEEEVAVQEKKLVVSELGLSTRLMNSLFNSGINDLTTLEGMSGKEIMSFKGMGKKSYDELIDILVKNGININI